MNSALAKLFEGILISRLTKFTETHNILTENLRYISAASQVQTLQATLNRSLSTTLHVYGHPTALLADTSIPPPYITQNQQLAKFRFRLHSSPPDTIQHFLWNLWQPLLQVVPLDTLEDRMQTAICHIDPIRRDPASPCRIISPWPNPSTKRNHTRNTLSLNVLIHGASTSNLHSATHQAEFEHTYTSISTTNTNTVCINQPHTVMDDH